MAVPAGADLPAKRSEPATSGAGAKTPWLIYAAVLVLWICLPAMPSVSSKPVPSERGLGDTSWELCNAYFLQHHRQAGVDFIFPTTALGFFFGTVCIPALFWIYWLWQVALSTLLTANLFTLARRYPDTRRRLLVLLLPAFFLPMSSDALNYTVLISAAGMLLFPEQVRPYRHGLNLLAMAFISLEKFTFLMIASAILLVGSGASLFQGRAERRRWLGWALAYAALFVALWVLIGQRLTNMPLFFHNLIAITVGYNATMGDAGSKLRRAIGFLALLPFCVILAGAVRPAGQRTANVAASLLLTLLAFLGWKHGFVRNDDHAAMFFSLIVMFALLLPVFYGRYQVQPRWYAPVMALVVLIALGSQIIVLRFHNTGRLLRFWLLRPLNNAVLVLDPFHARQQLLNQYAELQRTWALPQIKAKVKDAPIDVISSGQHAVLLNSLRFRNRPVYQSYSAYTPELAALNAAFFRGPQAPAYLLMELGAIDNRYLMQEDNLALLEVLRRYHPVLVEKGFPLLERNARQPAAVNPLEARVTTRTAHLGEEIPVSGDSPYHLLAVQVTPQLPQKLKTLLLRGDTLSLVVKLDSGQSERYRLIPEIAATGFLLDPLVRDTQDFVRLYGTAKLTRILSFHIEAERPGDFADTMKITLTGLPRLVEQPMDAATTARLLSPTLWTMPLE